MATPPRVGTTWKLAHERWPRAARELERAASARDLKSPCDAVLSVDGIQLESRFDRDAEARVQAELAPRGASSVTVYGTGGGALPQCLLERAELRRLRVIVLAPSATARVLDDPARCAWLSDPRVELALAADETDLRRPFAACAADLRLADEASARVRDLVLMELARERHARGMQLRYRELEERLVANRALLDSDADVRELFGTRSAARIHVVAAGPSLVANLDALRSVARRETLIAVDGALPTLLAGGIHPQVVTAVEPDRDSLMRYFGVELSPLRDARLAYAPIVHGDVLRRWPGQRMCFVPDLPRYTQTRGVPGRARLWCSGSVLHPSVDLAVRMGARDVVLHGADFAFTRGATHAAGNPLAESAPQRGPCSWVLDVRGARVPSQPNLIAFLRDLEAYVACSNGVRFWNAGREGAAIRGTSAWGAAA